VVLGEEFPRRSVGPHIVAAPTQQARHRLEHAGIVVDEENREPDVRHWAAISISCAGSEKVAMAPPASSLASESAPPCASTIVAQMAKPRRRRWLWVVKNAWTPRPFSAGRRPFPRSFTATSMPPAIVARVVTAISRWAGGVAAIASIAFIIRLSRT